MYNILHKVYHSVRSYANRLCEGIMDIIWYIFDMIGTIAFAISGALVGVARRMDIFGMAVLARQSVVELYGMFSWGIFRRIRYAILYM